MKVISGFTKFAFKFILYRYSVELKYKTDSYTYANKYGGNAKKTCVYTMAKVSTEHTAEEEVYEEAVRLAIARGGGGSGDDDADALAGAGAANRLGGGAGGASGSGAVGGAIGGAGAGGRLGGEA